MNFKMNRIGLLRFVSLVALLGASTAVLSAKGPSVETVQGAKTINAQEAKALWLKGAHFIDARKSSDWASGRVPSALHIDIKKGSYTESYIGNLIGKNEPVISYCNAEKCHRAASGAAKLVKYGFTQVYYFRDGFPAWKNAGYPYE